MHNCTLIYKKKFKKSSQNVSKEQKGELTTLKIEFFSFLAIQKEKIYFVWFFYINEAHFEINFLMILKMQNLYYL